MPFEVYATRHDAPGIVSQIIPAKGLSFSFPLSAHGECSFSATVESGRSYWRSSLGGTRSGILVAESQGSGPSVPLWAGRLKSESQTGPRTFSFTAAEWGSALDWFPAIVDSWALQADTSIYADILTRVQAVSGQNLAITPVVKSATAARSVLSVPAWDTRTAGAVLGELAAAQGGPEVYYTVTGSLAHPTRVAVLGDKLGDRTARTVLEYVESTGDPGPASSVPSIRLLASLFPGAPPTWSAGRLGRSGGNVLTALRTQDTEKTSTVAVAVGSGQEAAQLRSTASASTLLARGWPRITRTDQFNDVTDPATLRRHANAMLAASAGVNTGYALVTQGSAPQWRSVSRGSVVRAELDTDVYAGPRPLKVTTRVLNMTVAVPDGGGSEQVRWDLADVLEVV